MNFDKLLGVLRNSSIIIYNFCTKCMSGQTNEFPAQFLAIAWTKMR